MLAQQAFSGTNTHCQYEGCPVRFNQAQTCMVFGKEDLERRVLSSDEELASLLDGPANRYLEKRMAGRFAVRVRDLMIAQLPLEVPSKASTASMLGMTERPLLRMIGRAHVCTPFTNSHLLF